MSAMLETQLTGIRVGALAWSDSAAPALAPDVDDRVLGLGVLASVSYSAVTVAAPAAVVTDEESPAAAPPSGGRKSLLSEIDHGGRKRSASRESALWVLVKWPVGRLLVD